MNYGQYDSSYREIVGYPHLNECVSSLEILNIGGSNVLGEFIPFLLLHTPKLKSLGQWLNTMIYGLEILKVDKRTGFQIRTQWCVSGFAGL